MGSGKHPKSINKGVGIKERDGPGKEKSNKNCVVEVGIGLLTIAMARLK